MRRTTLLICLVAVCILSITLAYASDTQKIYTSGTADGGIFRYWWMGGSDNWVDTGGAAIGIDYYYGYWAYAVVSMPISSLAGTTLQPNSVKLNFHTNGLNNVALNRFNFDPNGTIVWSNVNGSQTNITTINTGAGWNSIDVTEHLQTQIDAGYNWAGFIFKTTNGNGSVSMSEGGNAAYLEVVPEPSGILGLMAGVSGILGTVIRRRK